jgi:serine/threonine protein kinase
MGHEFYGIEVDIWSLGCIFAELFINKNLFNTKDQDKMLWKIFNRLGSPDFSKWHLDPHIESELKKLPKFKAQGFGDFKDIHPDFKHFENDLLCWMLNVNPFDRPTCQQILAHPYFFQ